MKKIAIRIGAVVVALVIVVLVVLFFSLNTIVKKGVETVGPRLTKVEVRLDSADISPFSGSGRLSGLLVGNPDGFKTPLAIKVGSVKVAVEIGSVLSDTIVIDEVNVQAPEITLEGNLNGNNLTKILDNLEGAQSSAPAPSPAPASSSSSAPAGTSPAAPAKPEKKYILKEFDIEGGKINLSLTIPGLAGKSATVPLPPLHLQNIGVAENGVTAAQLAEAIMKPLVSSVLKSAESAVSKLGGDLKNLGKSGVNGVEQLGKGIGNLFK
jgi:uncharacterized protein involved in outer membrane biogenesis